MESKEKVVIFIDGSNLHFNLKKYFKFSQINFEFLCTQLTENRKLVRVYYYNSPLLKDTDPARYKRQQKFFDYLNWIPYFEIKLGRIKKVCNADNQKTGYVQKGVDVLMAIDMVSMAFENHYDTAILISDDSDFLDVMQKVKNTGKHIEYASFKKCTYKLRAACDRFIELNKNYIKSK